MSKVNPTHKFYEHLSLIARCFNGRLFADELPAPLFTLKRGGSTFAYFAPRRWLGHDGETVGEITLDPVLFAQHSWLFLMQTITQQQCHLWQHAYGQPSRPGYHNAEWARKMQEVGLMPSATGLPGGRTTGQRIFSYPLPDGKFINACAELAEQLPGVPFAARAFSASRISSVPLPLKLPRRTLLRLMAEIGPWTDDPELIEDEALKAQKRKLKYTCPACNVNVWGRPGLDLLCQACSKKLRPVPPKRSQLEAKLSAAATEH